MEIREIKEEYRKSNKKNKLNLISKRQEYKAPYKETKFTYKRCMKANKLTYKDEISLIKDSFKG